MSSVGSVPPSAGTGAGRHNVFVYGTLLENEIVGVLLKRVPPSSPAVLHGYQRFSIKGCSYPAIIPVENKKVDGKVLLGITDIELGIFDVFEDFEYERRSSGTLLAYTYVWVEKDDPKLEGDWDFNAWREQHLEEFLEVVEKFIEEYVAAEPNAPL
ncbi:unnamed protein product [Spirodela intermedia]|uniref:Putative gamma-glutamylcyclotransferase n=1 Tax=Spirodela intermedia TaxID=51605 RepID=A0A7I8IXG4_SPIIN|nr:unnamed protein product [Spirodela intermedia]CAA6662375.1 unnamed protein product [Spirodela intermedia]